MATTNFSPLLGLALPTTGDLQGSWGTAVNDSITGLLDSAVAGTTALTTDADVTLTTTNGAANQARNAVLLCTGARTTIKTITAPAQSKAYIIINATSGGFGVKIVGAGPTTGVTVPNGEKALVAWNGSDFVQIASSVIDLTSEVTGTLPIANGGTGTGSTTFVNLATNVTGTLPVGNGGTGNSSIPATSIFAANTANVLAAVSPAATQSIRVNAGGTAWEAYTPSTGTGSVTAVSVVSANGLAGTSSGGATPALTLSTSITGVLKGNGTAISAGTAGTDYVAPGTATTFTATQTFSGSSSAKAIVLNDAAEVATVSATAATGTINYDITTQSVLYYTTNASGNFTVNFRASSGTSLDTLMATGESMTVAFLVTNGATAYYNSAVQVDGNAVTPKWQGGTAPTAGNASSIDIYSYTIIKTGSAAFTVFASQTKFA
jgi:hypothetical protein